MTPIRVVLPGHLYTLAGVDGEVTVESSDPVTVGGVLDALETAFPVLQGAIRGHDQGPRRPYVRIFADGQDLSLEPYTAPVPEAVVVGTEPLLVVGSIAGG